MELPAGDARPDWVTRIDRYGPRAHHFEARSATERDAFAELPALLCESYRELGERSLHRR